MQLDSTAEHTTLNGVDKTAVVQDTQQSNPNDEPLPTDTVQLVPLTTSPMESSAEEDSSPFRLIDVLWEEEV